MKISHSGTDPTRRFIASTAFQRTMVYDAFISYRHHPEDRKWACWLQNRLERFRIPSQLRRRGKTFHLFRDDSELAASSDLASDICEALRNSRCLIVICSPRTPQSAWINAEIQEFLSLGRESQIYAMMIDGEPDDSFPIALPQQPLAADVRSRPGVKQAEAQNTAVIQLAAALLDVGFDDIRQREKKRRVRFQFAIAILSSLVVTAISVFAIIAALQWYRASRLNTTLTNAAYDSQIQLAAEFGTSSPSVSRDVLSNVQLCPPSSRDFLWNLLYRKSHLFRGALPPGNYDATSHSGDWITLKTYDGAASLWRFGEASPRISSPDLIQMQLAEHGRVLYSLTRTGTLLLTDLTSFKRQRFISASPYVSLGYSRAKSLLVLVCADGSIETLTSASTNGPVRVTPPVEGKLTNRYGVTFSQDGELFAVTRGTLLSTDGVTPRSADPADELPRIASGNEVEDGTETTAQFYSVSDDGITAVTGTLPLASAHSFHILPKRRYAWQRKDNSWLLASAANSTTIHFNEIYQIISAPNGDYLAIQQKKLLPIDIMTPTGMRLGQVSDVPISRFEFSPTSVLLAFATNDGSVGVWNLIDSRLQWQVAEAPKGIVVTHGNPPEVLFAENGSVVIHRDPFGGVTWRNANSGEKLRYLTLNELSLEHLTIASHDEPLYLVSSTSHYTGTNYSLVDMSSSPADSLLIEEQQSPTALGVTTDGHLMALGFASGMVSVYAVDNGPLRPIRRFQLADEITAIEFTQDGKLVVGDRTGSVHVYCTLTGPPTCNLFHRREAVILIRVVDDGEAVVGFEDGSFVQVDLATGTEQDRPSLHSRVKGISISKAADRVAFRPSQSNVVLAGTWDQQAPIKTEYQSNNSFFSVSPDGGLLAICSDMLEVFNVVTGRRLVSTKLKKMSGMPTFSPDGKNLAVPLSDGTILLFDAHSLRQRLQLVPSDGVRTLLTFSGNGERLFAAGTPGIIHMWNGSPVSVPISTRDSAHSTSAAAEFD